jgi:hypothetical protein
MADEDERDETIVTIIEAQRPSWRIICSTKAKTVEGLRS